MSVGFSYWGNFYFNELYNNITKGKSKNYILKKMVQGICEKKSRKMLFLLKKNNNKLLF
jgi:hypothetical protein